MTDERGRAGRTFTHAELDGHVASLYGVGGIYGRADECPTPVAHYLTSPNRAR